MKTGRWLMLPAMLALWTPAGLAAQQAGQTAGTGYQYWSVCGGNNGLSTCAAVDIWMDTDYVSSDGESLLRMRVWNLSDATAESHWTFTRIGFGATGVSVTEGRVASMDADYYEDPSNPPDPWNVEVKKGNFPGGVSVDFQGGSGGEDGGVDSSMDGGIQTRCRSHDPGGNQWLNGCASEFDWALSATGWVSLSFNYTGAWDFENSYLTFQIQDADGSDRSFQCITGTDDCKDVPPPTAVPEPMSMLLMATGVLGVGIVARRRRQSNGEEA